MQVSTDGLVEGCVCTTVKVQAAQLVRTGRLQDLHLSIPVTLPPLVERPVPRRHVPGLEGGGREAFSTHTEPNASKSGRGCCRERCAPRFQDGWAEAKDSILQPTAPGICRGRQTRLPRPLA